MKRICIKILMIIFPVISFGQGVVQDTSLSFYSNQDIILAANSITLKSGFHIPTLPAGRTVLIKVGGVARLASQPSSEQNYILTRTFNKAGVTSLNLNSPRSIKEESQIIQYFDGLGRPIQNIQVMGSSNNKDIIQHIKYDDFGREKVKYLPYGENTSTHGAYRANAAAQVLNYYEEASAGKGWDPEVKKTKNPFAITVFENSPLNRILEQGAPGEAWQPLPAAGKGHTIKTIYGTNTATDLVKLWTLDANGASSNINYASGKLYRITIRDENTVNTTNRASSVDEYKSLEGRVILKRVWETDTKKLDTYYVYDELGNLRYVLPPAITVSSFTELANDANFEKYIYSYKYDDRKRLVEKKIPGKGRQYLVYNKNDQLVLSQDILQRNRNEWTFNRYDTFGRITSTGLYTNNVKTTVNDVQSLVEDATGPLWETRNGLDYPVPSVTFPLAGPNITITPQIIYYYDDYGFSGASTVAASGITPSNMIQSLQTGVKVYKLDGTLPLLSVMYYDDFGRLIQSVSQNHLQGKDVITNTYSFVGELETSTRVHTPKTGAATTIVTKKEYDHVGRLTATKEKIGSQAEVILASNSYNEIGQLKATSVGKTGTETTFINTSTFSYNERGWLTKSSSPNFSQHLKYQDGTSPQWNGNISQQLWGNDLVLRDTFNYEYDKLNRLLSGISKPVGTAGMSELITYDELGMGNIKTLKRDALAVTTYSYDGNKLTGLTGGLTGDYIYDGNGNATKDRTGMIFSYNYLNLPQSANKTGTSVTYLYDARGTKLQKKSTVGTINESRDYIDGIEYKGTDIDIIHNGVGYALKSGTNYIYHYNLADHLGNVRATLKRGSTATAVDVTQRDNYYPFGKQKVVAGGNNKYLYNGKEVQGELGGQYDYGARFYDAEVGRWNVIDPLAEQMFRHSPYNYAFNNPIRFIDPDGMAPKRELPNSFRGKLGKGDWRSSDRENNTATWANANKYNLQNGLYSEYNSISQRRDFYGWFQKDIQSKGFETMWAGAAYIVASQMSMSSTTGGKFLISNEGISFANAGNKAIFEDVFDNLKDLYNGPVLTGQAAKDWDVTTLTREQRDVVDPLYATQSLATISELSNMAKLEGFYVLSPLLINNSGELKFKGNISYWKDRYNHGMNKVVPFYKKHGKFIPNNPSMYQSFQNPGAVKW